MKEKKGIKNEIDQKLIFPGNDRGSDSPKFGKTTRYHRMDYDQLKIEYNRRVASLSTTARGLFDRFKTDIISPAVPGKKRLSPDELLTFDAFKSTLSRSTAYEQLTENDLIDLYQVYRVFTLGSFLRKEKAA